MLRQRSQIGALAVLAALAQTSGCALPTRDQAELKAIKDESRMLMKTHPANAEVPKARWPRAIARLNPETISVDSSGVHIVIRPYFDGGWGYFVPRRERALPTPVERFEEVGQGVYWWHPY